MRNYSIEGNLKLADNRASYSTTRKYINRQTIDIIIIVRLHSKSFLYSHVYIRLKAHDITEISSMSPHP